jgi:hypothetical protein
MDHLNVGGGPVGEEQLKKDGVVRVVLDEQQRRGPLTIHPLFLADRCCPPESEPSYGRKAVGPNSFIGQDVASDAAGASSGEVTTITAHPLTR